MKPADIATLEVLVEQQLKPITAALERIAAALEKQNATPAAGPGRFCKSRDELATETGFTTAQLTIIRRHSDGKANSPFRGRGGWPELVQRYVFAEPDVLRWVQGGSDET